MRATYDILIGNPPMEGGLVGLVEGWEIFNRTGMRMTQRRR
jgi:hypothetical protein